MGERLGGKPSSLFALTEAAMRLLAVRLYRKECRMEVYVQSEDRGRLRVPFFWMERYATDVPPDNWSRDVKTEVERSKAPEKDVLSVLHGSRRRK